jgi:hypothetical protein
MALLPGVGFVSDVVGFGPNCESAVVWRSVSVAADQVASSLVLLDTASGRTVATLRDRGNGITLLGKSHDGRTWLLQDWDEDARQTSLLLLDVTAGQVAVLPLTAAELEQSWMARLSPDGRLVATYRMPEADGGADSPGGLVLWDTAGRRQRAYFSGWGSPYAFSADSRTLAAWKSAEETEHLGIVDLVSLTLQETAIQGRGRSGIEAALNGDGSYYARLMLDSAKPLQANGTDLVCWEVATGSVVVRDRVANIEPNYNPGTVRFGSGGNLFFLDDRRGAVRNYDLATGARRSNPAPEGERLDLSPHGRFLIWMSDGPALWRRLFDALGLNISLRNSAVCRLYDASTGHLHAVIPGAADIAWAPDGRSLAAQDHSWKDPWYVWDIPPRKPLTWFATAAGLLALPVMFLASWRCRRLRKEKASVAT